MEPIAITNTWLIISYLAIVILFGFIWIMKVKEITTNIKKMQIEDIFNYKIDNYLKQNKKKRRN